jgi:hypothetical protein
MKIEIVRFYQKVIIYVTKSNMILQSELIHDPLFPDRKNILEQFTEFTFRMHEASINFLDHSPVIL